MYVATEKLTLNTTQTPDYDAKPLRALWLPIVISRGFHLALVGMLMRKWEETKETITVPLPRPTMVNLTFAPGIQVNKPIQTIPSSPLQEAIAESERPKSRKQSHQNLKMQEKKTEVINVTETAVPKAVTETILPIQGNKAASTSGNIQDWEATIFSKIQAEK